MEKLLLTALSTLCLCMPPVTATPVHTIVNPHEQMVLVPGLQFLGASRVSTVHYCAALTHTDWHNLITDSDFESMQSCLTENT